MNYGKCGNGSLRTADVFPVVASIPPSAGETRAEKNRCSRRLWKCRISAAVAHIKFVLFVYSLWGFCCLFNREVYSNFLK